MKHFSKQEFKVFERLIKMTQSDLGKNMVAFLKSHYEEVIVTNKYIVAVGNIPIALVAHMDTVHTYLVDDLFYDRERNVCWSPEGLGADDRAGVFAILRIIEDGFFPHVILTTDEEKGGLGAKALASLKCPFEELKFMIELDRRGGNDCVFYDCGNKDFHRYIESFGFEKDWGSFSDISSLCPAWEVCGVNLSVGYIDEHTLGEHLYVSCLFQTISKVETILSEIEYPDFKWEVEKSYLNLYKDYDCNYWDDNFYYDRNEWFPREDDEEEVYCYLCGRPVSSQRAISVVDVDGSKINVCLSDCFPQIVNDLHWCQSCHSAFLYGPQNEKSELCCNCEVELGV